MIAAITQAAVESLKMRRAFAKLSETFVLIEDASDAGERKNLPTKNLTEAL